MRAPVSTRQYLLLADPGHAWLAVRVDDLFDLGIADKISRYSFVDYARRVAYLEEDCDAALYLSAARAAGWDVRWTVLEMERNAPCRNLPRWDAVAWEGVA